MSAAFEPCMLAFIINNDFYRRRIVYDIIDNHIKNVAIVYDATLNCTTFFSFKASIEAGTFVIVISKPLTIENGKSYVFIVSASGICGWISIKDLVIP